MNNLILIAGFRKCGTSYLYDLMINNYQVNSIRQKELNFWLCDNIDNKINFEWFLEQFIKTESHTYIDGSTLSVLQPNIIQIINTYFTNKQIILCLRDPAKRVFSAYLHMRNLYLERRSFDEIIRSIPDSLTQSEIYDFENNQLQHACHKKKIDKTYFNSNYTKIMYNTPYSIHVDDCLFMYRYIFESLYSLHSILSVTNEIIFFEKLINNPKNTIRKIAEGFPFKIVSSDNFIDSNKKNSAKKYPKWVISIKNKSRIISRNISPSIKNKLNLLIDNKLATNNNKISEQHYNKLRQVLKLEYNFWFEKYPDLQDVWRY